MLKDLRLQGVMGTPTPYRKWYDPPLFIILSSIQRNQKLGCTDNDKCGILGPKLRNIKLFPSKF